MKIRRFYSHNVRSALKQVTETFGEDAAILSNKKVPGGVEVIAALDYDESLMPDNPESIPKTEYFPETEDLAFQDKAYQNNPDQNKATSSFSREANRQKQQANFATSANEKNKQVNQIKEPNEKDHLELKNISNIISDSPKPKRPAKLEWSLDPSLQAMKEELELMRSMMSEQLKGIAWNRYTEVNPLKATIMRRLSELGLNKEALNLLLPTIDTDLDSECCWQRVLATLCKNLPMAQEELFETGGVFAFVGPTGVGKTTTIAKLAARFVIKHGNDSIALISTDNQRITAQEQLATFGRILKIPCANVSDKTSLDFLLKKYADKKLILIDTAGISANESALIKQLDEINNSHRSIKKLLLMSATSQIAVMQQSLKFFSKVSPSALIITKLDEATSLGEILSVVLKANFPIMYTTDGQKIPEDIRVARSHHLVSKAVWLANKYTRDVEEWGLAQSVEHAKSA